MGAEAEAGTASKGLDAPWQPESLQEDIVVIAEIDEDGGSGGGGGGGGDQVSVDVNVDANTDQADVVVTGRNTSGALVASLNLNTFSLTQLTLKIDTADGLYEGSINLDKGMLNQSYTVNIGGKTGTLSFATNGTDYSIGATLRFGF